ncbi:MAG: hypothetical protein PVG22_07830 [Chromatiales bacterium]|jgi:hypothetical protein
MLAAGTPLEYEDKENALYLQKSLVASREHWNYLAIFILSVVAIVADLVLATASGR